MSDVLPAAARTPPTPSRTLQMIGSSASRASSVKRLPRGLQLLPLSGTNGSTPPIAPMSASGGPELCTPVETQEHHTPPPELRRESLIVPASDKMVRMAQGSGVSVYRMDRSPREGRPRSPWVLKKANVSPLLVRERRRVERTLEHESCMLASMNHPNIVGFRAAQRLSDGHLCLALEHCEASLYSFIQERVKPDRGCVSPTREARAGAVFTPAEVHRIGKCIASGLSYLHNTHHLMHGDVKSANILCSRDLARVKICDLGVSIPLKHDLSACSDHHYEGTEPWRPPETLLQSEGDFCNPDATAQEGEAEGLRLCDRTDIFAFGLVLWEMLSGDVPHAAKLAAGDEAYRKSLGTRPPLPPLPKSYDRLERIFRCCTQRECDRRPSAIELEDWLAPEDSENRREPPSDIL